MQSLTSAIRMACASVMISLAIVVPSASQNRSVSHCLTIADVNERIDCLESGDPLPGTDTKQIPSARPIKQRAGPSFDCRAASNSIERAICSDPILSEWDLRMGRQYQQVLRLRKDIDANSAVENQRAWIQQRNARCSVVAETAVSNCLLDMTKQRVDDLGRIATTQPVPPIPVASTNTPTQVTSPPSDKTPSSLPASDSNSSLIVIFLACAVIGGILIASNISRRVRLAQERQRLVTKYGEEIAERIIAREVWQGMTDDQLIDSWGHPVDVGREITRTKVKETWKYQQIGKNRFGKRVNLEDGIVVGWKI
jgi:uncharacterized protein